MSSIFDKFRQEEDIEMYANTNHRVKGTVKDADGNVVDLTSVNINSIRFICFSNYRDNPIFTVSANITDAPNGEWEALITPTNNKDLNGNYQYMVFAYTSSGGQYVINDGDMRIHRTSVGIE